jgi:tRNA(fMet)-specific endonuclease VapC
LRYLLDTNAWAAYLRQSHVGLVTRLEQYSPDDLLLCSIVLGELIYGAEHSGPAHKAANHQRVQELRESFSSLPYDDAAAVRCGVLRAALAAAGTPIGPHDLMIAAVALAGGLTLVTHNTREFSRVPGLRLEDWQSA